MDVSYKNDDATQDSVYIDGNMVAKIIKGVKTVTVIPFSINCKKLKFDTIESAKQAIEKPENLAFLSIN